MTLLDVLLNIHSIIFILLFFYYIVVIYIKDKITNNRIYLCLSIIPIIVSILHMIINNYHYMFMDTLKFYYPIYINTILITISLLINKKSIKIIKEIVSVCLFLILLIQIGWHVSVHNLSYESYTKSFIKTINILKKEYVLNDYKRINYDSLFAKYYPDIEKAEKNKDEQLYLKTMFEFANEFKDGHFGMFVQFRNFNDIDYIQNKTNFVNSYIANYYGFQTVLTSDNGLIALDVDENSDAYKQGLRDGMTITKKDGISIDYILDNYDNPINSNISVKETQKLLDSLYIFNYGNKKINLSFIDNGVEKNIDIYSYEIDEPREAFDYKLLYDFDENGNYYTKMLDDKTGYLRINSEVYNNFLGSVGSVFDNSSYYISGMLDKKLNDLKEKGMNDLIIDLRGNTGGFSTESTAIASFFTKDSYNVFYDKLFFLNAYSVNSIKANGKYANIKIKVLVDYNTASAGDILVYLLKKNPNVTVYGITDPCNSAQSIGGIIYLSGGIATIEYPIYQNIDLNGNPLIDTNYSRKANIKVDKKIELTKDFVLDINNNKIHDYALDYVLNN